MSAAPAPSLRTWLRKIRLIVVVSLAGIALLAFTVDYAVLRIRAALGGNAYGSVTVNHYYAVLQKNGKTQFIFDPPAPQTCVNALFPHQGWQPCWYLRKHSDRRTDI